MLRPRWIVGIVLASIRILAASEEPLSPQNAFCEKRLHLENEHVKGLLALAKEARGKRMDAFAGECLEQAIRIRADDAEAKALAEQILLKPSKPAAPAQAGKTQAHLESQRAKLLSRTAEAWLKLALWCDQALPEEKAGCLAGGLALCPEHAKLRETAGFKLHPDFGWIEREAEQQLKKGNWRWKGEWRKWREIQAERLQDFRRRHAALGERFRFSVVSHFNIAVDLTDKTYEKELLEGLAALVRDQYRTFYGPVPLDLAPYDVIIFQQKADFVTYCKGHDLASFQTSMGFCMPQERCLYAWRADQNFLNGVGTPFHELTHGMLTDFIGPPQPPSWVDEGFASFFEKARPGKDGHFGFGPLNLKRMSVLADAFAAGRPFDLAGLFSVSRESFQQKDSIFHYNRSAMVMHYLYDTGKLRDFLHQCKATRKFDQALLSVTGRTEKALEAEVVEYAKAKLKSGG